MSTIRDAIIRLSVEQTPTTLQAPNYGPILEQEKRMAASYRERATACATAETTIRSEYSKTVGVLRELVALEKQRTYSGGGGVTVLGAGAGMGGPGTGLVGPGAGRGGGGGQGPGMPTGGGRMPTTSGYAPFVAGVMGQGVGGMGGGGGSMRNRFMGTYGNYEPKMSPTAAAKAAATSSGYNARNTAFNSGDPYWDNMRNRFGFGPIDAIANQGRSWGGAIGTGVGMAIGSQFGEMGMMAGAMGGQFAGQAAGYMATTGVGRQMLITGAERVAKSGVGQFAARFAGGVAGGAAVGGAGAAASGFLGGGVAASLGAAALPVAAVAALGYGANRATSYVYGREEQLAIGALDQRHRIDNSAALRVQSQYAGIRDRLGSSGFQFGQVAGNTTGMMGQSGNDLADSIRAQRGRLAGMIDPNTKSTVLRYRMGVDSGYAGTHLQGAEQGIAQRQSLLANMDQELAARSQGLQTSMGARQRAVDAAQTFRNSMDRQRAVQADMGLMNGRDSAEFSRITSIMLRKGKLNTSDLETLQSIAGNDAGFNEYIRKEGEKFFESRGFKATRDKLANEGIIGMEAVAGIERDRKDFVNARDEWEKTGGQTMGELQTEFDAFLKSLVAEAKKQREEIEKLGKIVNELKPANAGS